MLAYSLCTVCLFFTESEVCSTIRFGMVPFDYHSFVSSQCFAFSMKSTILIFVNDDVIKVLFVFSKSNFNRNNFTLASFLSNQ